MNLLFIFFIKYIISADYNSINTNKIYNDQNCDKVKSNIKILVNNFLVELNIKYDNTLLKEIRSMIMSCYYFKKGILYFEITHKLKPFQVNENVKHLHTIIHKIHDLLKGLKNIKKEIKSKLYNNYRSIKIKNILHSENKCKEANDSLLFLFCGIIDYKKELKNLKKEKKTMKSYYKYICYINTCYQLEVKEYYRRIKTIYAFLNNEKQKSDRMYNIDDNNFLSISTFEGKLSNLLGKINLIMENK
ncbi:hypothetical protein EHP00_1979 [Ecytonucleospora hepatopenaei]|uniref:Uncharacterized protein n=1 Tax=Ecytonucleospora hepatopenaei TaxID=646526 RepID=A0A1W0E257_9MICR|nr:hypothetical protein EHP00_1979 [Ecytonucleospora hepatopenaei]